MLLEAVTRDGARVRTSKDPSVEATCPTSRGERRDVAEEGETKPSHFREYVGHLGGERR